MKKNSDIVKSSASIIARQLYEQKGISRSDISSVDLSEIYRELRTIHPSVDNARTAEILAEVEQTTDDNPEPFWGVIVETREHPSLEAVISSVSEVCEIPVQLFHGASNREFILSTGIAERVDSGQVVLSALDTLQLTASDYNGLMMSPEFWKCMSGRRKILVFQADSICCKQSRFSLRDFSEYDYIGSNWSRQRPVGLILDGGNGGFSLRDWSLSRKCLASFDPALWPGGEDGYFAFHLELMGACVASHEESGRFGTQDEFLDKSLGGHRISKLKRGELEAFMNYCPEAKIIFPRFSETKKKE